MAPAAVCVLYNPVFRKEDSREVEVRSQFRMGHAAGHQAYAKRPLWDRLIFAVVLSGSGWLTDLGLSHHSSLAWYSRYPIALAAAVVLTVACSLALDRLGAVTGH